MVFVFGHRLSVQTNIIYPFQGGIPFNYLAEALKVLLPSLDTERSAFMSTMPVTLHSKFVILFLSASPVSPKSD